MTQHAVAVVLHVVCALDLLVVGPALNRAREHRRVLGQGVTNEHHSVPRA